MRSGVTSHERPILQIANGKGKYNKPLSKDYELNLPLGKSKIEKISSEPSVQRLDTAVSNTSRYQERRKTRRVGGH